MSQLNGTVPLDFKSRFERAARIHANRMTKQDVE